MGCVTSKQKDRLCRNCQGSCSPPIPRRSYSLHRRHEPPFSSELHHHLVSLTSSSLEPLKIESFRKTEHKIAHFDDDMESDISDEKRVGLIEAKIWSKMIDEIIPKIVPRTPIRTPPGEPEKINAWELMEGLEDISPLRPVNHLRSFSFHFGQSLNRDEIGESGGLFSKPMWLELADKETDSKSLEFDPNIISTFREALGEEENSGVTLLNGEILEIKEKRGNFEEGDSAEIVVNGENLETEEYRRNLDNKGNFEEKNSAEILVNEENLEADENDYIFVTREHRAEIELKEEKSKTQEKVKKKVVLYFTSLRGVRKTYEDCCDVRLILKWIGVKIDERDVLMHSGFKEELKELLGDEFSKSPLPRVFFGENYIGGADEIKRMHEEGRLEGMLLEGGDVAGDGGVCDNCGDVKFVPCERCFGSCKIYYGDEYECDDDDDEYGGKEFDESECGFQRCPDCNENGLVRCPICCD